MQELVIIFNDCTVRNIPEKIDKIKEITYRILNTPDMIYSSDKKEGLSSKVIEHDFDLYIDGHRYIIGSDFLPNKERYEFTLERCRDIRENKLDYRDRKGIYANISD